jgi:assimilatory nitrate reductase catalytic subunit
MGLAGFEFASSRDVFLEHARLSATENDGARAFNLRGVATLNENEFNELSPFVWPQLTSAAAEPERLFADGRYYHANGRASFIATTPAAPKHKRDEEYPFVLNTGRVRDQWHTMTRTGKSARLGLHLPEPYIDMHPQDVLLYGVRVGELARVTTAWGSIVARVRTSGEITRRSLFVPIHWNDSNASDARVGALVNPAVDPFSGQPELKHTPARVEPFIVSWYGFALSRDALVMRDVAWWVRAQGDQFMRYELAGRRVHGDRSQWARRLLNAEAENADWLEYADANSGTYRAVLIDNDRIVACLFISPRPELPSRSWLATLFAKHKLDDTDRASVLAGQSADPAADVGPIVCSCFGVGRNTICDAIIRQGCTTTQALGQKLKAGTNCGSCIPELKTILAEQRHVESAA